MPGYDDFDALLEESAPPRSEKSAPPSVEMPLVLVIDDDAAIRRSLEIVFGKQYRLTLCDSAGSGVAAFTDDVCAVVLDIKMKDQDGFWACDEIRKMAPDVPVLFYSAYQNVKDPFEIINRHRPFAYISKDGELKKLREALETATQLSQARLRMKRMLERMKARQK